MRGIKNLRRVERVLLFDLQDVRYIASHRSKCPQIPGWPSRALATRLPTASSWPASSIQLRSYLERTLQQDDVLRPEFLAHILVDDPGAASSTNDALRDLSSSYGSEILSLAPFPHLSQLEPGPYLIAEGSLWQVCRLYDDTQGAFVVGVEPSDPDKTKDIVFSPLRICGSQYQTLGIAAPSRAPRLAKRPLDGMRIAVKDMFEMNGLTTTLCNRAFYEISQPSTSTAACVDRLIAAGVHVLGTTKISSMISREEPTEAIDYHPPFNPRADGYQSPAGSSSGSGAATAAYEWLDFTVAEDTSGSGRRPAAANGIFQYRPTHDLVDLRGMWPTFLQFDTPVIFARDLDIIASVAPVWCGPDAAMSAPEPPAILYPVDYLPTDNEEHLRHLDSFVDDLASASKGTVTRFSIAQKWSESCPPGCSSDIREYLADVIVQTFYHGFYHSQASFRQDYFALHQKQPFVNSFVKWRWGLGSKVTAEEHREGLHRLEVYKSWLLSDVLHSYGKHSVLVIPISEGVPNYRDHLPVTPTVQNGFESLFLSPILGCPDLVLPIAQIEYESRVSGRSERLPICVNILGTPGQDCSLVNLARNTLQSSGRPCAVRAGPEMF